MTDKEFDSFVSSETKKFRLMIERLIGRKVETRIRISLECERYISFSVVQNNLRIAVDAKDRIVNPISLPHISHSVEFRVAKEYPEEMIHLIFRQSFDSLLQYISASLYDGEY